LEREDLMKRIEEIPATMKALMCCGLHDYRYEEIPLPSINEDEILVKIEAYGICAEDIKSYNSAAMFWGGGVFLPWTGTVGSAGTVSTDV
jgi:D-arabinose 1-dehydrogenase-like Zn-dependent alcohol dehydrogenase